MNMASSRQISPVLVGPGSDKPGADVARFVGDQIAFIVAETERQAEAACGFIELDWEDLPVITDPRESMQPGALNLFPDRENVIGHLRIKRGDLDSVWDSCAAIVEETYETPFQEHAYLQPEAGLAYIDAEGRVTIEVAGQWTHEGPRANCAFAKFAAGKSTRDLSSNWRRIWGPRRYVHPDRVSSCDVAPF